MGETIPPQSKRQLASERDEDPHESVTIAPPAPNFEDMLQLATPQPTPSSRGQPFQAAFEASARAGSNLSELSKIVAELSGGLSGAKQANEQMLHELSQLRAMLGSAHEQQLAARQRLQTLEQELSTSKDDANRERRFLTDQHDEFLTGLLEEHEESLEQARSEGETTRLHGEVSTLTQKLVRIETARLELEAERERARETLVKVQAQRDEAQSRAEQRERERDELRAEASLLRARLGTNRTASTAPPPPLVSNRRPPSETPPALQLDAGELDSTLHARSPSTKLPAVMPRFTPPPSIVIPKKLEPSSSSKLAAAAAFPRESTRPGVGGPKPSAAPAPPSFGPPPSGWTPLTPTVSPRPTVVSAASLPPGIPSHQPVLKQKPDPTTRPLIDYSLGGDGLPSETLEGARLSSKPPRK
jgi:hypothetical protein